MAAVAPVLFPEMRRRGSASGRAGLAAGNLQRDVGDDPADAGADHHRVGHQLSISALFTGGLLPALVAAIALVVVAWWRSRKEDTGGAQRAPAKRDRCGPC